MKFKNLKKQIIQVFNSRKSKILAKKKRGFSLKNHTILNTIHFLIKDYSIQVISIYTSNV